MQENANNQGLTLKDFLSIIWSKKLLVLIITVVITALTAVGSLIFTKTTYNAGCTMLMTNTSSAGEIEANKCVIILNTQNFFDGVVNTEIGDTGVTVKEKYGWEKATLRDKVSFTVIENVGGAFQISFESTNPDEAEEVMQAIFDRAMYVLQDTANIGIRPIELVHEPLAEDRQIFLKTAIGGVAGLVIAIVSVFVLRAIEKNKAQKLVVSAQSEEVKETESQE